MGDLHILSLYETGTVTIKKDILVMPASIIEIEEQLWKMADELRANTHLRAHEYSEPVLGLIFLKFAYETFKKADSEVRRTFTRSARLPEPDPDMYKALGALYLPKEARYNEIAFFH